MSALKALLLFCLFGPVSGPVMHPVYVSVTNIEWKSVDRVLEISCRVFTGDMEEALKKLNPASGVDLLASDRRESMDSLLYDYMKDHLLIYPDGRRTDLQYVGYEQDGDAIQIYLQVSDVEKFSTIRVTGNILYEILPKQVSIIHVKAGDNRQSRRLVNPEENAEFSF